MWPPDENEFDTPALRNMIQDFCMNISAFTLYLENFNRCMTQASFSFSACESLHSSPAAQKDAVPLVGVLDWRVGVGNLLASCWDLKAG